MKVAVAIPCYNCEPQIQRTLAELDSTLSSENSIAAVYVLDNRSSDGTLQAALSLLQTSAHRALYRVFQNHENIGLGGTHKVALTLAEREQMTHLLILHGDHQATAFDIPALIQASRNAGGMTVLGSRFAKTEYLSGYSRVRTYGNLALNGIYSLFTGKKISDLGSGLNLFRLSPLKSADYQSFENGFTFNMDLLLYLIKNKIAFRYVPIHWSTSDQISNARALSVGLKTLMKLFYWKCGLKTTHQSHDSTKAVY